MAEVAIFDASAVFAAVSPAEAIERTRTAFERHAAGEWVMPAKVYVEAPPDGDFRAMPARGDGLGDAQVGDLVPPQPASAACRSVAGALLVSSAESGELLAIIDCAAVTSLRTGAAAAVSALALAREDAAGGRRDRLRRQRRLGRPLPGGGGLRSRASASTRGPRRPRRSPASWAGAPARATSAAAQDVVVTVTPADAPVIGASDLRPGQHLAVLGADARGKAEVELEALDRCRLFCDEWEQASQGGELSGAVAAGAVDRGRVTEIGAVLLGRAPGRRSADEITLFDSTGLAIQDLGIAAAVLEAGAPSGLASL